jgi:hypothetical protein
MSLRLQNRKDPPLHRVHFTYMASFGRLRGSGGRDREYRQTKNTEIKKSAGGQAWA